MARRSFSTRWQAKALDVTLDVKYYSQLFRRLKLLPTAHSSVFIDRIQSRSCKVLALAMVAVLLAFVLLFAWSTLSAEATDESVDHLLLFCILLVLFLSPLPHGKLLLTLYEVSKLNSIWYSALKRPG